MVSPYPVHEIFMWMQARIPDSLIGAGVLSMHVGLRKHPKNVKLMEEKQMANKKSS